MSETMPTSEVLNRAADLIEERGWGTGNGGWNYDRQPLCLEGGILAALGENWPSVPLCNWWGGCPAYAAVASYLERPLMTRYGDAELWAWNDAPGRTAAEVIETLRACAVIEASREREAAEVSA